MKKVKYLAMLLAAGMFAACSDNLEDTGAGNAGGTTPQGETGYVNISLNLPTTSGGNTRANDNFDDGLAAEYNVNNAIIALFYGADEASATCQYAFKLSKTDFQMSGSATDNITSYYASGVRMIQAPTENQHVYALAILNAADADFSIEGTAQEGEDDGTTVLSTKLKVSGTTFNGTLADIQTSKEYATSIASTENDGNFLMTNAPIASATSFKKGSAPADFKVTTLAPITVYNDKDIAAGSAPANPIYVERAVAKTTVKVNSKDGKLIIDSEVPAYDGASVVFDGWKLQNTNKKYYTVRKVKDATLADWEDWKGYFNEGTTETTNEINRFFGQIANPYRTYWGIDPNYSLISGGDLATNFNIYTNENEPAPEQWNKVGNTTTTTYSGKFVEYCAENTTIAKAMQDNNLTSVLLKATFTPKGAESGDDFFMLNNFSAIYSNEDFLAVATGALAGSAHDLTEGQTLVRNKSVVPVKGSPITNIQGVKDLIQISASGSTSALSNDQATTILTAMGNNIKYYQGGVTYYYATLIEHFGDAQAPIASDLSISDLDKYNEGKHLGRWGVVRNNWYELNITSVSGPGEPDIPEIPEEPADKTSSYINCQINVLSWATRQQNVEL